MNCFAVYKLYNSLIVAILST